MVDAGCRFMVQRRGVDRYPRDGILYQPVDGITLKGHPEPIDHLLRQH